MIVSDFSNWSVFSVLDWDYSKSLLTNGNFMYREKYQQFYKNLQRKFLNQPRQFDGLLFRYTT